MEMLTITEELDRLVAELNLDEQFAVAELLRVMIANRVGKKHGLAELGELSEEEKSHTLSAMGIDAQDYVNELRGKREPGDSSWEAAIAAQEYADKRRGQG